MKKIFSVLMAITVLTSLFTTRASAAPTVMLTPTPTLDSAELGQLKVCKVAGAGVTVGKLFTINVNNVAYSVPAGPGDGGYCVLAGQFPVNTQVTVQESIPAGYYVSHIEVKPDRSISRDLTLGKAVVEIGSGVTEVILTNRVTGSPTATRTPTPVITSTPGPSNTPTATPRCAPNCTPTPTSIPQGRLQICKEADGAGVSGYFDFNFANKSKTVPVGACSALLYVEAGTLTVTEVAQAGYSVTDIYTIPADRLISKNLNARTVKVTIVQGNAASQTIVVFRNRAGSPAATPTPMGTRATPTFTPTGTITPPTPTPTGTLSTATFTPTFTPTVTGTPPTPTFTPTGTLTPPVCTPTVVTADFSGVALGQSIEGMGVVAPNLNIDAKGTAVKILEATEPLIYLSPNGSGGANGSLSPGGGFSDVITKNALQAHLYTFTFAAGVLVNNFSLHMQDFGDWNPSLSTAHFVSMTAYDVNGAVVSRQELSYTTPAQELPRSSNLYGDLWLTGDATTSVAGQPGNWTWRVSGNGIVRVVLEFGVGYDPNVAFDALTYGIDCQSSCTPTVMTADFSGVALGQSIEGMGVVAPNLNIDAKGTAVKILEATEPLIYLSPNGSGGANGSLSPGGGFSDVITKNALQAHLYTFTFAAGVLVNNFSLHMQDFGDWNPSLSTAHFVSMTAYDVNGAVVSRQELSYTTPAQELPRSSNLYGDLWLTGDATTSVAGQPGNWTWRVSGNGIVRVVLEFGVGYDPNVAFDALTYGIDCQSSCTPTVMTADFSGVALGQSVEGMGVVAPNLNIDAKGTAVKILEATEPLIYLSPNGSGGANGGLSPGGGFSDVITKNALQAHLYTFTFAAGVSASDFSVHMQDFGDWNPSLSTAHFVSMTAYDVNGAVVSRQELSYTTPAQELPRSSNLYGDLWLTGDAVTSVAGQPGNWIWRVSGNGIVRVVLEFGVGYDPNVAFDLFFFTTECPAVPIP